MREGLWRWSELQQALSVAGEGPGPDISGVSIDTRTIKNGELFVALKDGRDGHDFISDAESGGAGGVLISKPVASTLPQLRVGDTRKALEQLARHARQRMSGRVAAITGSAGKTTARSWLEHVLGHQAGTHASEGSYNNHWGVPLSLARMPADSTFGVFEIGMNHPGEIRPLTELVRPHVAVVMNVLPAHIGNMGTLEAIRKEKLSIRHGLMEDGSLLVPDTLEVRELETRPLTFGFTPGADFRAVMEGQSTFLVHDGNQYPLKLSVPGEHRIMTALAVLGAACLLGADLSDAASSMADAPVPDGRGNTVAVAGRILIDDSYNANALSMCHALDTLRSQPADRRIALLGEMLELGDHSKALHQEVLEHVEGIDQVITVGNGFEGLTPPGATHYRSAAELDLSGFAASTGPGDVILIKGGNKVFWTEGFVSRLASTVARVG